MNKGRRKAPFSDFLSLMSGSIAENERKIESSTKDSNRIEIFLEKILNAGVILVNGQSKH
jgi:hypothetical protein